MANAVLHYSMTPKSKVPGAGGASSPQIVNTIQQDSHPFSPPHQQPSPMMKASIPPSTQQPYIPSSEGMQKQQIPTNLPPHYQYQQQDPMAPVGAHTAARYQGYPASNIFQRNTSSSSTSSQAWDPNSSGGSTGMPQQLDLNASSSSISSAHSPHKWDTQGSADSNKGYTPSYSNQVMTPEQQGRGFANFPPSGHSGSVPPHQMPQSPPQAIGLKQHQPFGQNFQQQGIAGTGYWQQFAGSPQGAGGHMIPPPNPSERARPSSGPITFQGQGQADDQQREGLWMGRAHQPQQQQQQPQQQRAQRPNSGRLFQISPQPGYGNQGKLDISDILMCEFLLCKVVAKNLYCIIFLSHQVYSA